MCNLKNIQMNFIVFLVCMLSSFSLFATIEITEVVHSNAGVCSGSIEVNAAGSAGPFTVEVSLGNVFIGSQQGVNGLVTFSDLCTGEYTIVVIAIGGKCEDGGLFYNNALISSGRPNFFTLTIDNLLGVNLINEFRTSSSSMNLLDVAYSDGVSKNIALAFYGSSRLSTNGLSIPASPTDRLVLVVLSESGNIGWHEIIDGSNMDENKLDLTFGALNETILGLTLTDNITIQGNLIEGIGNGDISLIKFGKYGQILGAKTFGTIYGETISNILYDNDVIYFGGEYAGLAAESWIGNYRYKNLNSYIGSKAYISYIFNDEFDPLNPISNDENQSSLSDLTSINDLNEEGVSLIEIFPSPFNDVFHVNVLSEEVTTLNVVNTLGQSVFSHEVSNKMASIDVNLEEYSSGLYFINAYDESGKVIKSLKIIKN